MYQFSRNITLFLLLVLSISSFSQNFSLKGTEFIFPNINAGGFMHVITENIPATVTIKNLKTGNTLIHNIPADTNYYIFAPVPFGSYFINNIDSIQNIATQVTSTTPVFISYKNAPLGSSYPIIPIHYTTNKQTLSTHPKKYQKPTGWLDHPTHAIVTSMHDSNIIKITPTKDCMNGWISGNTYTIKLNKGQSYHFRPKFCDTNFSCTALFQNFDLSSTTIESNDICKTFNTVIYNSHSFLMHYKKYKSASQGGFLELSIPDKYFGNEYFVIPEQHIFTGNLFKILSVKNNTKLFINNTYIKSLSKHETFDTLLLNPSKISGTNSFLLNQYYLPSKKIGYSRTDTTGANLISIYPIKYRAKFFNFYFHWNTPVLCKEFLYIVTETSNINSFTLNGSPLSNTIFTPFPADPSYSYGYLRFKYPSFVNHKKFHRLKSTASFQAWANNSFCNGCHLPPRYNGGSEVFTSHIDTVLYTPPPTIMLDTCLFDTITLEGLNSANSWLWNTGDTTVSIKTFSGGLYWVKNIFCTDTLIDTFDIQGYIYEFRKEYICPGEKISFGSHTITLPGVYIDTFVNNLSCDTVVHLDVFFKNPAPDSTFVKDTICLNDTIQVGYKKYYETGVYYDTLRHSSGCDSIYYYIDLLVYKDTTFLYDSVCDYEYSHFFNDSFNVAGTYFHTLQNHYGCDSIVVLNVAINPSFHAYFDTTFCVKDSISIFNQIINHKGINSFNFKTTENCDSIIDYNINNYCPNIVFIPNTFTPDKDGINEIFLPKFVNEHEITRYSFLVFNRWGESIFETKDVFKGWDGKHEGIFSKTGVYIWKIIYTANGETKEVFGHVHLLR